MSLANKVEQFNSDVDLISLVVHGGPDTVVQTQGGPVKSIANVVAGASAVLAELAALAPQLNTANGAALVKMTDGRTVQAAFDGVRSDVGNLSDFVTGQLSTSVVAEGTRPYFTNARALAAPLAGLSLVSAAAVANGDSILVALGKLQKQISNMTTALDAASRRTGDVAISARSADYSSPSWLPCDGSAYLRTSYPDLANALGVTPPTKYILYNAISSAINSTAVETIAFSPDSQHVAFSKTSSAVVFIYKRSGSTFTDISITNVTTNPLNCVAYSANNNLLGMVFNGSGNNYLYRRSGDTYTYVTAFNLHSGIGRGIAFSPDGTYAAIAHDLTSSICLSVYKITGNTVTKLTLAEQPGAYNGQSVAFSPDGNHLAVGTTSGVIFYKRAGDVFTKLAQPTGMNYAQCKSLSYNPAGTHLAAASLSGTELGTIYKRNGDTYSRLVLLTDPAGGNFSAGLSYSGDGQHLVVNTYSQSPYVYIFKCNGDLYSRLALQLDKPVQSGRAIAISPDSSLMAVGCSTGSTSGTTALYVYETGYDTNTLFKVPTQDAAGVPAYIKT
jgi:WD40 repeat protein